VSAVVGLVGTMAPRDADEAGIHRALTARRGGHVARWADGGAVLLTAREPWEEAPGLDGPPVVAAAGPFVVVADASLYYVDALIDAIRGGGGTVTDRSSAGLILAAWLAWGPEAPQHLEGDFAFLVWDRELRVLSAARDFGGKRPLFLTVRPGGVAMASSVRMLLAQPGVSRDLDAAHVAEASALLALQPEDTSYLAIESVAAGRLVSWRGESGLRRMQWWRPQVREAPSASLADGAMELRQLLVEATAERMRGVDACVTLSGGYDSSAVFAAALHARTPAAGSLGAVSMSYPEGDPGREDELIDGLHAHLGTTGQFCAGAGVDLLADLVTLAGRREDAWAHPFEAWNRALFRRVRSTGAHVVFDGGGGDPLFGGSPLYLADLLREGRWLRLLADARAMGVTSWGAFAPYILKPALPQALLTGLGAVRGRPLLGVLERPIPRWIRSGFATRESLAERQRAAVAVPAALPRRAWELQLALGPSQTPRIYEELAGIGRDEAIALRSPLWDRRVIALAVSRPAAERCERTDGKRLLRAAMQAWLPEAFLRPRARRTGTMSGLLANAVMRAGPLVESLGRSGWRLADMGILEPVAFATAWERTIANRDLGQGGILLAALRAEAWLQGAAPAEITGVPVA
jgi:asparagine synthase (glutamine-hydrolysing)